MGEAVEMLAMMHPQRQQRGVFVMMEIKVLQGYRDPAGDDTMVCISSVTAEPSSGFMPVAAVDFPP